MKDPAGNALAYLLIWSVERKKSFERLTPDVNVINLFFTTDEEAK